MVSHLRGPVGRTHADFRFNSKFGQLISAGLHHGPIAVTSHDDKNLVTHDICSFQVSQATPVTLSNNS